MRRRPAGLSSLVVLALLTATASAVAQTTTITISPTSKIVVGTNQVPVTIRWCGYPPEQDNIVIDTRVIKVNGTDVTSEFDLTWDPEGCGFQGNVSDEQLYTSTGTITVDSTTGPVTVTADVWNYYSYLFSADQRTFSPPGARPSLQIVAEQRFVTAAPSSARTERFTVYNLDSRQDTFTLAATGCASGAIATACTLSSSTLVVAAGGGATVTASYTASATPGSTGLLGLRATSANDPTIKDSVWTDVTVASAASAGVVVVGAGPGISGVTERDLCVTVALVEDAASECGDLRLTHPLPDVRTFGAPRAPTLIYNSQHAHAMPVIIADVTLASGLSLPTTVTACLSEGGAGRGCKSWPGSQWGAPGQTRRVVIPDSVTLATGPHALTISVTVSDQSQSYSALDTVLVVNRSADAFGAGWWIAGVERIVTMSATELLWIGGDGSNRVYTKDGSGIYRPPYFDRHDSITTTGGGGFIRATQGRVRVYFDAGGRHDSTVNRLGYPTRFLYTGSVLTGIRVPGRTDSLTYSLYYTSDQLDSVVAPGGRLTRIYHAGARVDSIGDPDGTRVRFSYGTGAMQYAIASRTDRRSNTTTFAYDDGRRLRTITRPLSNVLTLLAAETRGLDTALALDSAFASIDGPRTDVADRTRFWVNGHGAPTRIRTALGQETRIRYSSRWPGLADSVMTPSRLATRAVYDSTRALLQYVRVFNAQGSGDSATTTYTWHPSLAVVLSVRSPTGLLDTLGYDTLGNRTFEQRGTDSARRVTYAYDASYQLERIVTPGADTTTIRYSPLGNPRYQRTPLGLLSLSYADGIGRDTLTVTPTGTGSQATDSATVRNTGIRNRFLFDAAGRDTMAVTIGPLDTLPNSRVVVPDTIRIRSVYDANGNRTSLTRSYSANLDTSRVLESIDPSEWVYDALNRVTQQRDGGTGWTYRYLDAAGNDTSVVSGRGYTVRTRFDAMNRPTRRILPEITFANSNCHVLVTYYCSYSFPTREGSSLCTAVDTVRFTYDQAGNLRRAENNWAWVRRAYAPNGLVTHDTLFTRRYETEAPNPCGGGDRHAAALGPAANDFTLRHVYALRYTYDLEGRRRELYHPAAIDQCTGSCVETYGYNSTTGTLDTVIGPQGDLTRLHYDAAGRVDSILHPGSQLSRMFYDKDSRLVTRYGPDTDDNLTRDAAGRVISGTVYMPGIGNASIELGYKSLGGLNWASNIMGNGATENLVTDALGNRLAVRDYGASTWNDRSRRYSITNGRLEDITLSTGTCGAGPVGACHPNWYQYEYHTGYDLSGNQNATWSADTQGDGSAPNVMQDESRSYFGPDEKLVYFNRHLGVAATSAAGGVFEEYRYDALGRRVYVRSRTTANCTGASTLQCGSYVERTVWDGDQVLYEIRSGGRDSIDTGIMDTEGSYPNSADSSMFGIVAYTHAGGIDQPLGIARNGVWLTPFTNWQGDFTYGVKTTGAICPGGSGCPVVNWPGNTRNADGGSPGAAPIQYSGWFGGLINNKSDGSGLQYMRNRYYDPATGRFTQQDPIGLAGGLNLYGFAGGDPVNFADPFGLCEKNDGMCLALVRMLRQRQGDEFQTAASRYDALRGGRVRFVPGSSDVFNAYGRGNLNTDSDPWSFTGGTNSGPNVWLNADLERGDFLVSAVHESYHLPDPYGPGLSHWSAGDTRAIKDAERRAYNQLSPELRDKAPLTAHWLNK